MLFPCQNDRIKNIFSIFQIVFSIKIYQAIVKMNKLKAIFIITRSKKTYQGVEKIGKSIIENIVFIKILILLQMAVNVQKKEIRNDKQFEKGKKGLMFIC